MMRRVIIRSACLVSIALVGWPAGAAAIAQEAGKGSGADVRKLIAELGSDHFRTRERASARLRELGPAALPALRAAAASNTILEVKMRATTLIDLIYGQHPDKRGMRRLLAALLDGPRLADSRRADAFYLVCFGRSPTERERCDANKRIAQIKRSSAKANKYFDELLYDPDFKKGLAQVYLHVMKINDDMRRAVRNPTRTPAGGVPSFDDKLMRREMEAAARVLVHAKLPLTDNQKYDLLSLVTLRRFPHKKTYPQVADWLRKNEAVPQEGMSGIIWALVNSKEFLDQYR